MQYWDPIQAFFLDTDISGWFGPIALIAIAFIILSNRKYKPLGILFLILQFLAIAYYVDLVDSTPWYWWNILTLVLGMIICIGQAIKQ